MVRTIDLYRKCSEPTFKHVLLVVEGVYIYIYIYISPAAVDQKLAALILQIAQRRADRCTLGQVFLMLLAP